MDPNAVTALADQLGAPTLAYLLGVETDTPEDTRLISGDGLTEAQRRAVTLMHTIRRVRIDPAHPQAYLMWSWLLVQPSGIEGKALGTVVREWSGATVPDIHPATPTLEHALQRIAVDAYPSLLMLDHFESAHGTGPSLRLRDHPLHDTFLAAAEADQTLRPLLTVGTEHGHEADLLYRSTGNGMTFSPTLFAEQLITATWTLMQLDDVTPAVRQLPTAVTRTLGQPRKALRDETTVPARTGFAGILLPETVKSAEFGWSTLRPSDSRDSLFAELAGLSGSTSTNNDGGATTTINFAGDLVLEFTTRYAMRVQRRNFDEPWPPALQRTAEDIDTATETIRLGLLLSTGESNWSIYPSWRAVVEPLSFGRTVGWEDPSRASGLQPTRLTEAQVCDWEKWVALVHEHRTNIRVGVRRMLLAINDRTRPEDVLVDAVIVWENLFGVREETTESVTDALACLLNPTGPARNAAKIAYRKIYKLRSEIVHGALKADNWTLQRTATEAVAVSVAALQELFENRHDLLHITSSERRNAAARATRAPSAATGTH